MSLPTTFANATTATGLQLDQNFAALGALTPIPCTASGSNTIVLAANSNTPTVTAYSNYMQFSAIAAQSNSGTTTAKVGSLATLSVYKQSPSGAAVLAGGEIVANCPIRLMYDSTLNSGSGGFWLLSNQSLDLQGGTITGPLTGSGSLATLTYPVAVLPLLQGVTLASIATAIISTQASIAHLVIGAGPSISRLLSATGSLSWASLNPQTSAETSIAVAGCSVGDNVMLGFPSSIASQITYRGYVNNAGTIAIVAANYSASTITPTPGTYRATALGFT